MHDEMAMIADRVRGVLAEKRKKQDALASVLGMSRQSANARLNGRVPFTGAELLRLSIAFGVPISRFFPPGEPVRRAA
jgi:transcriptional regulator with XRE-family HTH domain